MGSVAGPPHGITASSPSLARSGGLAREGDGFFGSRHGVWLKIGVIAAAFGFLFFRNLTRLWEMTNPISGDENWKHAMCIPAIGLYYLFLRREELLATPVEPLLAGRFSKGRVVSSVVAIVIGLLMWLVVYRFVPQQEGLWIVRGLIENGGLGLIAMGMLVLLLDWGLATLIAGVALSGLAVYPLSNNFIGDFGMILTLFGIVLTMCGWRVMRIAWFPIIFLVCMLPWPPLVYSQVAHPLQVIAARVAVTVLQITGIDASYGGTKIFIPQIGPDGLPRDRALNVAEACAGMKGLMNFISIGAAIAFLSARPLWQKIIITFSAIPIAIACNVARVAGMGLLDHYVGPQWSEGFAHQFAGMVMMLPGFLLILLVCWIVDNIFIEEAPEANTQTATASKSAGGAA